MKNNTYNALRLFAGLLTIVIIVVHQYIPNKRISVVPNPHYYQAIYSPDNSTPAQETVWVDVKRHHLRCVFAPEHEYSCGYSLSLSPNYTRGLDMSEYDGLNINVTYTGDAQRIRIYMRHYDPTYARGDRLQSSKFLSTIIRTDELNNTAFIKLSEFSVSEWWVKDFDIPREHVAPAFSNIISLGFDFANHGEHDFAINSIELTGSWIQKESLYLAIIIFWMVLIVWEGLHRFYSIYRSSRAAHQKIAKLKTDYDLLELEKSEYETLSTTDVLTGALNRAGIMRIVDKVFEERHELPNMGILLFDIDHFKHINDLCGHDCGDRILKDIAQLIAENTRQNDAFGRWGGEEFVLLCFQIKQERLLALAEKLRCLIAAKTFEFDHPEQVTISIGATCVRSDDSFDSALKKADVALYKAKHQGRNCVVFHDQ